MAMDKRTRNEEYDALNGWREENTKYDGGSEYDPTVAAILAYERAKAAKKRDAAEDESTMGGK